MQIGNSLASEKSHTRICFQTVEGPAFTRAEPKTVFYGVSNVAARLTTTIIYKRSSRRSPEETGGVGGGSRKVASDQNILSPFLNGRREGR